jgi:hypothetical protein
LIGKSLAAHPLLGLKLTAEVEFARVHPRLSSTLGHTSLFSAYITWTLLNIGGISDR